MVIGAACAVHVVALFLLYRSPAKEWLEGTAPDAMREKTQPYNERGRVQPQESRRRSATPLEALVLLALFAAFTAGIVMALRFGDGLAIISSTILIALPLWLTAIGLGLFTLALPWRWSTRLLAVVAGFATGPLALGIVLEMAREPTHPEQGRKNKVEVGEQTSYINSPRTIFFSSSSSPRRIVKVTDVPGACSSNFRMASALIVATGWPSMAVMWSPISMPANFAGDSPITSATSSDSA